jgi:hypothetical protein
MIATAWVTCALRSLRRGSRPSGVFRSRLLSRCLAYTLALLTAVACGGSTEPLDVASTCERRAATGVYGCTMVTGLVENDMNERQQGALVTAVPLGEPVPGAVFLSDSVITNDTGRYWLYVLVKSPPATDTLVEPVDVRLRAILNPSPGSPAGTPTKSGEIVARLHLQPPGASIDTVEMVMIILQPVSASLPH